MNSTMVMSTLELPADVSAQIHSHYTSPNSTLQGALKQFSNAVGYPFDICISWPSLYAVYAPAFPHKTTFIPALSSFIVEMLQSLINYLEEKDDPGGFQDQWLRICEEHPSVYQAGLLVRARDVERPKCYFARPRTNSVYRWILDLPHRWGEEEFRCLGAREGVIWRLKDEPDPEIDSGRGLMIPEDSTSASTFDIGETPMDAWSLLSGDVGGGLMPANMESDLPLQTPMNPYTKLPALSTLPPPAQLFSTDLASYNHLLIMHANSASIDIQCTHQPTLELIRDYFTKHARLNQNKTTLPPFVKIELLKSMWGSPRTTSENPVPEEPKDASVIALAEPMEMLRFQCREELNYGARLDHAYIVGFVEGVCGYRLVEGCTGESGRWVFRRMFMA